MEHRIEDTDEQTGEQANDGETLEDSLRRLRMRRQAAEYPTTETSEEVSSQATVDDLAQEIRRLGRELFRANRAAERNQQLFEQSLAEIGRLSEMLAEMPTAEGAAAAARFEAKAELCRDILGASDAAAASVAAADELIERLAAEDEEATGLVFRFASGRRLRDRFASARRAMGEWRNGQRLLSERLKSILAAAGVRAIPSVGRPFDPMRHRAVAVDDDHSVTPGTILDEELCGYTLEGRILRYAEVIVAGDGEADWNEARDDDRENDSEEDE